MNRRGSGADSRNVTSLVAEHFAQFAREGFGLAGVSGVAADKSAVMAREHGHRLVEQSAKATAVRAVTVPADSSPAAITMRVGAVLSASRSGR